MRLKVVILFLIIAGALWMLLGNNEDNNMKNTMNLNIQGVKIEAEIAQTSSKKAKGLSGRESLADRHGMIFVYDEESSLSFWMKDMKFSIDIIWIKDDVILDITENASPEPGPEYKSYKPQKPVNRVLELNAGFVKANDIKIGQKIEYERSL